MQTKKPALISEYLLLKATTTSDNMLRVPRSCRCAFAVVLALEVFILKDAQLEFDNCPCDSHLTEVFYAYLCLKLFTLIDLNFPDNRLVHRLWQKAGLFVMLLAWVGYEIHWNECSAMASSMMFNYLFYLFWSFVVLATYALSFAWGMAVAQVAFDWH